MDLVKYDGGVVLEKVYPAVRSAAFADYFFSAHELTKERRVQPVNGVYEGCVEPVVWVHVDFVGLAWHDLEDRCFFLFPYKWGFWHENRMPLWPATVADEALWKPKKYWEHRYELPMERKFLEGGELSMGGTMVCVQRCYEPPWFEERNIKDQVYLLISTCFDTKSGFSESKRLLDEHANIDSYAWDFVFLVFDSSYTTVLGCCFVDLRDTRLEGKVPYLYICDLCTRGDYVHLSLGTQMVHGVQSLGCMLLQDRSPWGAFPRGLYLGLTVSLEDDTDEVISRMYRRCGLARAERGGPLDFIGYTPFIPYLFLFESHDKIPMCMRLESDVMYEDVGMRVYTPTSSRGCKMYHAFPGRILEFVEKHGLVCPNQAKRVFKGVEGAEAFAIEAMKYTALGVWFFKEKKHVAGQKLFVIRASDPAGSCPDALVSHGMISRMLAVRVG